MGMKPHSQHLDILDTSIVDPSLDPSPGRYCADSGFK